MLATTDASLAARVDAFRSTQTQAVLDHPDPRVG
jgi:phosphoribosylcarboxyaminoimidazole (NCAIR) mutase